MMLIVLEIFGGTIGNWLGNNPVVVLMFYFGVFWMLLWKFDRENFWYYLALAAFWFIVAIIFVPYVNWWIIEEHADNKGADNARVIRKFIKIDDHFSNKNGAIKLTFKDMAYYVIKNHTTVHVNWRLGVVHYNITGLGSIMYHNVLSYLNLLIRTA